MFASIPFLVPDGLDEGSTAEAGTIGDVARVLVIIAVIALTIYCTVEVAQSQPLRVRAMPKWMWAFTVICLPIIGPILWLGFGRPNAASSQPRRDQGPDGDDDFLRGLRP